MWEAAVTQFEADTLHRNAEFVCGDLRHHRIGAGAQILGADLHQSRAIRIDPDMIRRVTSYEGALLEEAHPEVHDVLSPDVARTMTAMLEEVIQFGTGIQARSLGRPAAGKTGTTQDYTDAWFIGFTPQITSGVWVGSSAVPPGICEACVWSSAKIWASFGVKNCGIVA